jgi:hypothetical protein
MHVGQDLVERRTTADITATVRGPGRYTADTVAMNSAARTAPATLSAPKSWLRLHSKSQK